MERGICREAISHYLFVFEELLYFILVDYLLEKSIRTGLAFYGFDHAYIIL